VKNLLLTNKIVQLDWMVSQLKLVYKLEREGITISFGDFVMVVEEP
jgi:hypothetical protein